MQIIPPSKKNEYLPFLLSFFMMILIILEPWHTITGEASHFVFNDHYILI